MPLLQAWDDEIINSDHIVQATRSSESNYSSKAYTRVEITLSVPRADGSRTLIRRGDGAVRIWRLLSCLAKKCMPAKSNFPEPGSLEDAEFGVSRPHAEPGPPLEEASYSPSLSEIDDAS